MEDSNITWLWMAAGGVLILLETVLPGGVVAFVGISALLVGLVQLLGWWQNLVSSFTAFFILSIVLLILFRNLATKFVQGHTSYQSPDEDSEAFGTVVDVTKTVNGDDNQGRVHFHGTTWPAISLSGLIPKGRGARIVSRDNLTWIVEPVEEDKWLSISAEQDPSS